MSVFFAVLVFVTLCGNRSCVPVEPEQVVGIPCEINDDCDDNNECTVETCVAGECVYDLTVMDGEVWFGSSPSMGFYKICWNGRYAGYNGYCHVGEDAAICSDTTMELYNSDTGHYEYLWGVDYCVADEAGRGWCQECQPGTALDDGVDAGCSLDFPRCTTEMISLNGLWEESATGTIYRPRWFCSGI